MNKYTIMHFLLMWFAMQTAIAQIPTLDWAGKIGKNGSDYGYQVHAGLDGNMYVVGTFKGNNVDFNIDTAAAEVNMFSSGAYNGSVLVKYTKTGDFLGGFVLHSDNDLPINGTVSINSIYVESDGAIYVTGFFQGTTDFDPGVGETILSAIGDGDIFIAKYSSDFTIQWVSNIGAAGHISGGEHIVLASDATIMVTGNFSGTCDFDPDGAVTHNLTSYGSEDAFIAKYQNDGAYIFAFQVGGSGSDHGYGICVNNENIIFATGKYSDDADMDPDAAAEEVFYAGGSGEGTYLASYTASGEFLWAHELDEPWYGTGRSVTADNTGNVYFAGTISGEVDFNMDDVAVNADTTSDFAGYIVKYQYDGTYLWHALMEGTDIAEGYHVSIDGLGGVNLSGYHNGTTDFNYANDVDFTLTAVGGNNCYIANYSTSGLFKWAFQIDGTTSGTAYSCTNDAVGDLYVTGWIKGTGDFNPDGTDTITWGGGEGDIFFAKYITEKQPENISDFSEQQLLHVYPNPAGEHITITMDISSLQEVNGLISLTSLNGQIIQEQNWNGNQQIEMMLPANLPSRLYVIQLATNSGKYYAIIAH